MNLPHLISAEEALECWSEKARPSLRWLIDKARSTGHYHKSGRTMVFTEADIAALIGELAQKMLKLVKVKDSQNWYIRGTVARIRLFESARTSDKAQAESLKTVQAAGGWESIQVVASVYGHLEQSAVHETMLRVANGGRK